MNRNILKKIITVEGYELLTIDQAAKTMGVHIRSIRKWMQDGRLKPVAQIGKSLLVDKKDVKAAADSYQKTKPRSGVPQDIN